MTNKGNLPALNIVDAVGILTTLSDLGETKQIIKDLQNEKIDWNSVDLTDESTWLSKDCDKEKEKRVKEMFRVILNYLKDFYDKNSGTLITPESSNRIHTIMVLLGRAAKKLEKYTNLFNEVKKDITKVQEWRDIQNFYQYEVKEFGKEKALQSKIDQLWQSSFALKETSEKEFIKHIDHENELHGIDVVKQDTHYELFYLKKENRGLFFEKDIVKEIQKYCREEDFFEEEATDDPLLQVKNWHDKSLQAASKAILKIVEPLVRKFYAEIGTSHRRETVVYLNKTLMSLMLAGNSRNLLRTFARKSCYQYFRDFLSFLRETLSCRDFINICENKNLRKKDLFANVLWELPHNLCYALYTHIGHGDEMHQVIQKLCMGKEIEKKEMKDFSTIGKKLGSGHLHLEQMLKSHPNGPIFKVLDLFLEGKQEIFDPMLQDNVPQALYKMKFSENNIITHMRLPSPTQQEYIHKAFINDEFRSLIRFLSESARREKLLLINFQSRTDWNEYARSISVENLQNRAEFTDHLTVVTLTKSSDFYHQFAPYNDLDHAILFMDQFEEHMESESSGFYFPKKLKSKLFPVFIKKLFSKIHEGFFDKKPMLSRKERLNFIEVVYTFITLKIIEIEKPSLFSFSCKDGLDLSLSMSAQMALCGYILKNKTISEKNYLNLFQMLYTFPLFVRERAILQERFYRMLHTVDQIDIASKNRCIIGMFDGLFDPKSLDFDIHFQL